MQSLKLLILSIISLGLMLVPTVAAPVFAAVDPTAGVCDSLSAAQKAANPVCTASSNDPVTGKNGIIMTIANLVAYFAGGIAIIMIIFAAFRIVKSSGDSGKITQARETILYAIVGLIVIVLARVIVGLVISKL